MTSSSIRSITKDILAKPEIFLGSRSPFLLKAFLDGWILGHGLEAKDVADLTSLQEAVQKEHSEKTAKSWARILDERHSSSALEALKIQISKLGW